LTDASTQVYREISQNNPDLINWLDLRNQIWNIPDPDGNDHVFVDNSIPRDRSITPLIVEETVGFALFDGNGEYVASFKTLVEAERAKATARIVINTDVSLDDDEA
jgi:hypothetical protein